MRVLARTTCRSGDDRGTSTDDQIEIMNGILRDNLMGYGYYLN